MGWLSTADDEVRVFHPAFEAAAIESLATLGVSSTYRWHHHVRHQGQTIPDFALRHTATGHYRLIVEIKRTRTSVLSTRTRAQAHAYATEARHSFAPGAYLYYVVSNLELTLLCACDGERAPSECLLANGIYQSGDFARTDASDHRDAFVEDLTALVRRVLDPRPLAFDAVWPAVGATVARHCPSLDPSIAASLTVADPASVDAVRTFFSDGTYPAANLLALSRPLLADFFRGILVRAEHPEGRHIPRLSSTQPVTSIANAIERLRSVDFALLFEPTLPQLYAMLSDARAAATLGRFVDDILQARVAESAAARGDSELLFDELLRLAAPQASQGRRGLVPTDPELADLLVALAAPTFPSQIIDPCCGDGSLLQAAYRHGVRKGNGHDAVFSSLSGIEVNSVLARLAVARLAALAPKSLAPSATPSIACHDMFAMPEVIGRANTVLMNPPFKRYERQDDAPVPPEVTDSFVAAIARIDGSPPFTLAGQPNLYNYFVEFALKAMGDDATIAIILDNRWYHSRSGRSLRALFLTCTEVVAIVEYAHEHFFADVTIATSIIVARKRAQPSSSHMVKLVRCTTDPRSADLDAIGNAVVGRGPWPFDWTCAEVRQSSLRASADWRPLFSAAPLYDFSSCCVPLREMFAHGRRGSLQKEGGGLKALELPFDASSFDFQRQRSSNGRRFATAKGRRLTDSERNTLTALSSRIPQDFRGLALVNSDGLRSYVIDQNSPGLTETIEPPLLRSADSRHLFELPDRADWTDYHTAAVQQLMNDARVSAFVSSVGEIVGLDEGVLPQAELWIGLREPYAGELIFPRAVRTGHRVHINRMAFQPQLPQLRASSNFISYSHCIATDDEVGLDRRTSTALIHAFLVSSFGFVQLERISTNREGLRKTECYQLDTVRVLDPRTIPSTTRERILEAVRLLPYPVRSDLVAEQQPELLALDRLIAEEIHRRRPAIPPDALLTEVHSSLSTLIAARRG